MAIMKNYPYRLIGSGALATLPYLQNRIATSAPTRGRSGRSYTMTTTKRRRRGTFRKSFKSQVFAVQPAKHLSGESSVTNTHNTILTVVPTQAITQGTSNTSRQGDAVYLAALKIKFNFQTATASNGYVWRILVGWTGEEVTTAGIATGLVSGLGATEIFLPTTFANWTVNGIVNPKTFTLLYDQTIDLNSQVAAASDVGSGALTVPLNTTFDYQASGSVMGKVRNLAVVVIGGCAGGVTGVTAVGNAVMSWDLIFKV